MVTITPGKCGKRVPGTEGSRSHLQPQTRSRVSKLEIVGFEALGLPSVIVPPARPRLLSLPRQPPPGGQYSDVQTVGPTSVKPPQRPCIRNKVEREHTLKVLHSLPHTSHGTSVPTLAHTLPLLLLRIITKQIEK